MPAAIARRQLGARRASSSTSKLCRDKLLMKQHLTEFGIPMTRFREDTQDLDPAKLFAEFGSPVVRKFRKSSGGRGLQLIRSPEEFVPAKQGVSILERFIDAPEASVESFINDGRIQFANITDYHIKGHTNFVPAVFEEALTKTLLELNERVITALGITWGMTHMEVYLTSKGPLFGEIAMRPPGGYIMNAINQAWDFNPWEAFLAMELDEPFKFPRTPSAYAASEVLHPGVGRVVAVRGKSQVLDQQGIREFRLKVKIGQQLDARNTLGQDTGYVVHASATHKERLALHNLIQATLQIELESEV
jgi:biotin carboxylase